MRLRAKLVIFFLSTATSLVFAELTVRALGYHGETSFDVRNTVLVNDPVLNWRHRPNSVFYFNDVAYQINERGFRDYLYPFEKGPHTFRIFVASDSVGFGTNVQMQDSYPKVLETALNALKLPFRVEVINYSMPGLSIRQKFHLVELYAKQYDVDLTIVDYVMNDIEFESHKDPQKEYTRECSIALIGLRIPCLVETYAKKSAFLFFAKQAIENMLHKLNWEDKNYYYGLVQGDFYQKMYSTQNKKDYLMDAFRHLGDYQRENGIPIVVPIFPLIYDYEQYRWKDINEMIIRLCRENSLQYVSLLEDFQTFSYNDLRVQRGDFTHPSIRGNKLAVEAIVRTLVARKLLGNIHPSRSN